MYTIFKKAGFNVILPFDSHRSRSLYEFLRLGCYYTKYFCEDFFRIIFTKTPENMLYEEFPDIFYYTVAPRSSIKCLEHYR